MLDRLALTLLMDWLALSTSTVTTGSSLLSAMGNYVLFFRSGVEVSGPESHPVFDMRR